MNIGLLGPLELTQDGAPRPLGGPRQQIVLAALALHANQVAPQELLVDAIWGESPPETARTQVQSAVSALRKACARAGRPDAIETTAAGYRLRVADEELDAHRFARLLARARWYAAAGDRAEAARHLREALALWRGPALLGLDSDPVRRGATLLDEQRLTALEELARLDLALGRHAEMTGELFALAAAEPLREGLHASLMLALYRSGRQAEALEVYRRLRAVFAAELGIEPGRALQDLEAAVLNRDPSLDAAAPVGPSGGGAVAQPAPASAAGPVRPEQLPSDLPDFTGRGEYLAGLTEFLGGADRVSGGTGEPVRIAGICGKDGVGKSSLAVHAAHRLRERFPDGRLYAALADGDGGGGGGDAGGDALAGVLAGFLRALGVPAHAVPEGRGERQALYRSLLAGRQVLIVLDDVADEAAVRELLPGDARSAVLVTGRYPLTGLPGIRQIRLDVLDEAHSVELLTRIAGAERIAGQLPAALELAEFCGGLPLALRVVGARLACRPHWTLDRLVRRFRDEAGRLDEFSYCGMELRSHITLAYRALDPEPARLLRLLTLLDAAEFPGWAAAALLGTDPAGAEDAVEELVHSQLLDLVPGGDGDGDGGGTGTGTGSCTTARYRFHGLIRVFAREQLLAAESAQESADAVRRVLETWLSLAAQAHRQEHGGDFLVLHGGAPSAPYSLPAAAADEVLAAPGRWWEREHDALVAAVRRAAGCGLHEVAWELAVACAGHFEIRAHTEDWRECGELALAACEEAGDARGAAAARTSLAALHLFRHRAAEAGPLLAAAAEVFRVRNDRHGSALVRWLCARADAVRGDHAAAAEGHAAAAVLLREAGDRAGEALALAGEAAARLEQERPEEARELLTRALGLSRETGSPRAEAETVRGLGALYLHTGEGELAAQAFNWALRMDRAARNRTGEAHTLLGLGLVHLRAGRAEAAEGALLQALALARRTGDRAAEGRISLALGRAALEDGAPEAAVAHLAAAREVFGALGGSRVWQGRAASALFDAYAAAGDPSAALAEASAAEELLSPDPTPAAARLRSELAGKQLLVRGSAG
ncbi:BTAD domain-containing putative transcriptional regulator [Streptomyces sp. NBC_01006]|uniref:AfsR/SARP family transcriptional regulator n=1 Tax=Streptomyces sp. NBC_01006 TaxID=2903716 RepID=UPI002F9068AA|nr:tetratricopeptide repeat protein [Streptomyces sp. NBC_01006]